MSPRTHGRDDVNIHFNDSATADASAETMFAVITDYAGYPAFNDAVAKMTVVRQDERGAEFVADRKLRVTRRVRAYDRYERGRDLVIERTYEGNETARSTWTIHPVDGRRCRLTIDAEQSMGWLRGVVMKPLLRRIFYKLNFAPFVHEAERRFAMRNGSTVS
jgi:ribosome-associated toxin RatA of RatAB toxin-antitoxin module